MEKKVFLNQKRRKYIFAYSFLAVAVIHFAIFYIGVNINSILLAFQSFRGLDENLNRQYVFSLGNFERVFRDLANPKSDLFVGFINTLKYFGMSMFIMMPLSFIISYFIYKKLPLYKTFRIIFLLPSMISGVVFVAMFKIMVAPFGPIYALLDNLFGYQMPALLTEESTATATIMFYVFWTGLAGNMILYQGAMSRVPDEVIEVGKLDGISWVREMCAVVLPMIWPTFSITVILGFTGLFTGGGPILLFSEAGAPMGGSGTMTLSFYIYYQTWRSTAYEYPAAIGVFFTLCSLPIVFGVRWLMSKIDPEVEY